MHGALIYTDCYIDWESCECFATLYIKVSEPVSGSVFVSENKKRYKHLPLATYSS